MKNWLLKILKVLNPEPPIGGLEISESGLHFILLKNGELISASLGLPPGVIEEGKIKNADAFRSALRELHSKITPKAKKPVSVIATIPEKNLYVQVFNLPMVASNNLEEAVKLNLQMTSPVEFQTVYSDWQKIGELDIDGGQLEILSAFAPKQIVDEFMADLKAARFVVAAIETPGLALARLITSQDAVSKLQSAVLLRLSSDGLSFNILKNGNLYFNRLISWQAGQISLNVLEDAIIGETQKVLNFYASRWSAAVDAFLIVAPTPAIEERISQAITKSFSLPVHPLGNFVAGQMQKFNISSMDSGSLVALGSAIRGLIPRSKDAMISAASVGTEEDFRRNQMLHFVSFWRNVVLTVASSIFVIFLGAEGFLVQQAKSLETRLGSVSILSENQEFNKLYGEVKEFNQRVELALEAKSQSSDWVPFLEKIRDLAGKEVSIKRIFVQSLQTPVLINAEATSEDGIINFKNALSNDAQFQDVNLPFGSITPGGAGMIDFSISFKIKSL